MEFTFLCNLTLEGKTETWIGTINPLLPFDGNEYEVSARGSCFHLIIGSHMYSKYIYIPTWNVAMDISYLSDRIWNENQLLSNYPELSPVDIVSIVEAMAAIQQQQV